MINDVVYPEKLLAIMRASKTPPFSMEIAAPPLSSGWCANCGGIGHLFIFAVERGPFQDVPGGVKDDSILRSVDDPMYGWVWYIGKDVGAECPVCKGMGKRPNRPAIKQFNTAAPVKQLAEQYHK